MAVETKRLFIGGLFPSVTPKDLEDRFRRFGKVSDVNIKTKNDTDGKPLNTFAHMSIVAADADIKKCKCNAFSSSLF